MTSFMVPRTLDPVECGLVNLIGQVDQHVVWGSPFEGELSLMLRKTFFI